MLNTIALIAQLAVAQPADALIAYDIHNADDHYEYKEQIAKDYPGVENFWSTDLIGIFFKGAKVALERGAIEGDFAYKAT